MVIGAGRSCCGSGASSFFLGGGGEWPILGAGGSALKRPPGNPA